MRVSPACGASRIGRALTPTPCAPSTTPCRRGLITSQQGRGTFVAAGAQPAVRPRGDRARHRPPRRGVRDRPARPGDRSDGLCRHARNRCRGSPRPRRAFADQLFETVEIRRELRRQIGQSRVRAFLLCARPPAGDLPTAPSWAEGHVAGVEELEQIRDILVAKLFKARGAAEERARREGEARAEDRRPSTPGPLARAMSWWGDAMGRGTAAER